MEPIWAAWAVLEVPTTNLLITSLIMVRFWSIFFVWKLLSCCTGSCTCPSARALARAHAPARALIQVHECLGSLLKHLGSSRAFKQKRIDQNRTIIKEVISKLVIGTSSTAWAARALGQPAQVLWQLAECCGSLPERLGSLLECLGSSRAFKKKKFVKIGPLLRHLQHCSCCPSR